MIDRLVPRLSRRLSGWLALGLCVSVTALGWLGYYAASEWQQSAGLLAKRRASEGADLVVSAFMRDMRGVQNSVLLPSSWDDFMLAPPYEVIHVVASAFARYPYPEVFFTWRGGVDADTSVVFFSRSDRPPSWMQSSFGPDHFPVTIGSQPTVGRRLVERVAMDALEGRRYSIFDIEFESRHQIVTYLMYDDRRGEQPRAVFGFMVDMDWVQQHYFQDLTREVAQIAGTDLMLSLVNDRGQLIAGREPDSRSTPSAERAFPIAFFEPMSIGAARPTDLSQLSLVARAAVVVDPMLQSASQGARRSLGIAVAAGLAMAVGLLLTVMGVRANATLVEMRSEFVASVTHELRAPLGNIRALAETLLSGRIRKQESLREYAQLVVNETKRLTRLVDNLLAYSRVSDVAAVYLFEPLALNESVADSVQERSTQLASAGFEVRMDVPSSLPLIRADRTAIGLLLDNLIDNAIRYSSETRSLEISARRDHDVVVLTVADRGVGIPDNELAHVTRKFFRGRHVHRGGSGLGLAIVERIVVDHGGRLDIHSRIGLGTSVIVRFLVAREGRDHETAHSSR
jgi:signal transduction histidine kinase